MNLSFACEPRFFTSVSGLMIAVRFTLGAVGLLAAFPSLAANAAPATNHPNIIMILADDLRWDALGCAGNPVVQTPEIDRLAATGTRFSNAFVTTAICCVSRASVLTGQYARRHGVEDFQKPIADLSRLYPVQLRRAGYYTGFIGKWGVGAHGEPRRSRSYFQECAAAFDFWAGDEGQTLYWHDRNCNYLRNNGTTDRTNSFCSCGPGRNSDGCGLTNGPNPALKEPIHAETEFVPAKIRSFLAQRDTAKPFCLSVSFKAPHTPWHGFAPRFQEDYSTAEIPRRASVTEAEARRQPDFLRRSLFSDRGLELATNFAARNQLFAQYYRLIAGLDFCMGELRKELERLGLAENTVILFSSDNGHFAGEHGFFGKWLMHEESIRVPLIVRDPRLPAAKCGQVAPALTLNIDLAPTILELAGQPVTSVMQGRSLLPFLQDPGAPGREDFFYEHHYRNSPQPPKRIEPSEGVRTRDWKYIVWLDQTGPLREELYDLRADPFEMKNLVAAPAARSQLEQLRRRHEVLARELK